MSFQPVTPLSGYAGWLFLTRTRAHQQAGFDRSAQVQRETAYFTSNISKVKTADDLVADRRLLAVALGAFGLDADINSRAFIRKVLDGGTLNSNSLANRLSDKRYLQMATAFGFDDGIPPNTSLPSFADKVVEAYRLRQFETAVGQKEPNLRLALGFSRDLAEVLKQQPTDNGRWFAIMGNAPLRQVVQKALGLPEAFGGLDIDRQLTGYREAALRHLGISDVAKLGEPEIQEKLIRRFLIRSEVESTNQTMRGQIALTLLQSARR